MCLVSPEDGRDCAKLAICSAISNMSLCKYARLRTKEKAQIVIHKLKQGANYANVIR